MAILSVVSFLLIHVIVKSIQLNRLAMSQLTQIITQSDLATRFRNDVAAASGRLDSAGEFVAGDHTLILDFSPLESPSPSAPQVVWQWDGTRLWRATLGQSGPARVVVAPEERYRDVAFSFDKQSDRLRLRLELEPYSLQEPKGLLSEEEKESWRQRRRIVVEAYAGADRR
jgi:hypothetical protein